MNGILLYRIDFGSTSLVPVRGNEAAHLVLQFQILGRLGEEAPMRHALEDMKLYGHASLSQGSMHPGGIGKKQIAGAGLQERRRKSGAESSE